MFLEDGLSPTWYDEFVGKYFLTKFKGWPLPETNRVGGYIRGVAPNGLKKF
jgi:hypothetical protein